MEARRGAIGERGAGRLWGFRPWLEEKNGTEGGRRLGLSGCARNARGLNPLGGGRRNWEGRKWGMRGVEVGKL